MSLLKKFSALFSQKDEAVADDLQKIWIFREPRLKGSVLKEIHFKSTANGGSFNVANISSTGIALTRDSFKSPVSMGSQINGTLRIVDDEIETSITAVRMDDQVIGFTFNLKSSVLERILKKYFQIEIAALKMLPMKPEHLASISDGTPHCFNGNQGDKLYFIESKGEVHYFELSFLGYELESSKGKPIKIDKKSNDLSRTDLKYQSASSGKASLSGESAEKIRNDAERFVFFIEKLDSRTKTQLIEALASGHLK